MKKALSTLLLLFAPALHAADLAQTSNPGLGQCVLSQAQLCELRLVMGEENRNVAQLQDIRFFESRTAMKLCRGDQIDMQGLSRLQNHVRSLMALKRSVNERTGIFTIPGRVNTALEEMDAILTRLRSRDLGQNSLGSADTQAALLTIQELAMGINYNYTYPVSEDRTLHGALFEVLTQRIPNVGTRPQGPACNLKATPAAQVRFQNGTSLAIYHPINSTFWSEPPPISQQNLGIGYGRRRIPNYNQMNLKYESPKDGYGINPGFNAENPVTKDIYKIRLGMEVKTGPFNSKLLYALGYPVLELDYVANIETNFDLKLFKEFNSRRSLGFNVSALFVHLFRIELQKIHNPFEFIRSAKLRDGRSITGAELQRRLLRPGLLISEDRDVLKDESSYDMNFAREVTQLTWIEASVEMKKREIENLGSWSYDHLGHDDRREVRGFGVFAAWVGIYDVRWENTRLFSVETVENGRKVKRLRHVISDLGSGLGSAEGVTLNSVAEPGDMKNNFIEMVFGYMDPAGVIHGPRSDAAMFPSAQSTFHPRFYEYSSLHRNAAFVKVDYQDTIWMALMIGQISTKQIEDAARASGFSEADVVLIREKLVSRKSNLLEHSFLDGNEIRWSAPNMPAQL